MSPYGKQAVQRPHYVLPGCVKLCVTKEARLAREGRYDRSSINSIVALVSSES